MPNDESDTPQESSGDDEEVRLQMAIAEEGLAAYANTLRTLAGYPNES